MENEIRIGGLGPLTLPGIPWAGRELSDGMRLAAQHVNDAGGVMGRPLTLIFEDTHGQPQAGVAAVEKLLAERVHAFAGEFHSVVADALVEPVQRSGLPFICASATLDRITTRRLDVVFRLAPPQSYGWVVYADFLAASGFRHVVAIQEDNLYWNNGSEAIEARLRNTGVRFTRLLVAPGMPDAASRLRRMQSELSDRPVPDILLLLVAYPDPLRVIVAEARNLGIVPSACVLGDPAGRTVFPDWWELVGADFVRVPFLTYARPTPPTSYARRISADFKKHYAREPTFVALEGYDSVLVLARAFAAAGSTSPREVCDALRRTHVEGTRGTISFTTERLGVVHQQWKWPPVCVVAYRRAHQPLSEADVLWDTGRHRSDGT